MKLIKSILLFSSLILLSCGGQQLDEGGSNELSCAAPAGHSLETIQSVVDWINAMDKPLTLPCFLSSLPRPLATHATLSALSAQPSVGSRSPRIFFQFGDLMLTVTVDQDLDENLPTELEQHLLEMSLIVEQDPLSTLKGEVRFPILTQIEDSAPYEGIIFDQEKSVCALCHGYEYVYQYYGDIPAYRSVMLKPDESVSLSRLGFERARCDFEAEPHRCAMLASIVDHGELFQFEFPAGAESFFEF